jgi:hypothetical protein
MQITLSLVNVGLVNRYCLAPCASAIILLNLISKWQHPALIAQVPVKFATNVGHRSQDGVIFEHTLS